VGLIFYAFLCYNKFYDENTDRGMKQIGKEKFKEWAKSPEGKKTLRKMRKATKEMKDRHDEQPAHSLN